MAQVNVVLITGVSSGIGQATASMLLDRGFRTFGTLRATSKRGGLPPGMEVVRLDVRDEESARFSVQTVFDQAGRIDALINNAGYAFFDPLEETSMEEARQIFETNFFGVLRMCNAVLPIMRQQKHGRIVNICSVLGLLPAPYMGICAASKHALDFQAPRQGYSERVQAPDHMKALSPSEVHQF